MHLTLEITYCLFISIQLRLLVNSFGIPNSMCYQYVPRLVVTPNESQNLLK